MNINPSIFRAYDIRGRYPVELNEQTASVIGHAFCAFLREKGAQQKLHIALARDARISSPKLFAAFVRAVREEGCDVVDLGIISTPMLYFAVFQYGFEGGAMITEESWRDDYCFSQPKSV